MITFTSTTQFLGAATLLTARGQIPSGQPQNQEFLMVSDLQNGEKELKLREFIKFILSAGFSDKFWHLLWHKCVPPQYYYFKPQQHLGFKKQNLISVWSRIFLQCLLQNIGVYWILFIGVLLFIMRLLRVCNRCHYHQ